LNRRQLLTFLIEILTFLIEIMIRTGKDFIKSVTRMINFIFDKKNDKLLK